MRLIVVTTLTLGLLMAIHAHAAEIALRSQCDARGPVVTLGDVAEIVSADPAEAEQLAAIELFPAPAAGRQHFARQRELQDLLFLRGINLAKHQFSGSSQVAIRRGEAPVKRTPQEKAVPAATQRRAKRQLEEAIIAYLNSGAASTEPWTVQFELDETQSRLVAAPDGAITISGGQRPWSGKQHFEVTVRRPNEPPAPFAVEAQVTLPAGVVVTSRLLPRGIVLCAADVAIKRDATVPPEAQTFQSIDEVVGSETTRAMGEGTAVERDAVRSPLLVRRSEVVTVTAMAGGVRVTTNARARADGSLGELVPVESLHDRTTYFARVSGLREVEVYAGPVKTRPADMTGLTSAKQGTQR